MTEIKMFEPTCPKCSQPAGGIELGAWERGVSVMCAGCGSIFNQDVILKARKGGVIDYDHLSSLEAARKKTEAEREVQKSHTPIASIIPETLPQPAVAFKQELMSLVEAKELWAAFEETKKQLLTGEDTEIIEGHSYICKSGWRKIATRFRISTELISMSPMSRTKPLQYRAVVKAINMGGRFAMGVGFCSEEERKPKKLTEREKAAGKTQAEKDAKGGWSYHKEHDIMTQAEVRATNRAIADLVGCAEISVEEVRALKAVK